MKDVINVARQIMVALLLLTNTGAIVAVIFWQYKENDRVRRIERAAERHLEASLNLLAAEQIRSDTAKREYETAKVIGKWKE